MMWLWKRNKDPSGGLRVNYHQWKWIHLCCQTIFPDILIAQSQCICLFYLMLLGETCQFLCILIFTSCEVLRSYLSFLAGGRVKGSGCSYLCKQAGWYYLLLLVVVEGELMLSIFICDTRVTFGHAFRGLEREREKHFYPLIKKWKVSILKVPTNTFFDCCIKSRNWELRHQNLKWKVSIKSLFFVYKFLNFIYPWWMQDLPGALDDAAVTEALELHKIKNRQWAIFKTSAIKGEGIFEGLDW